jgi:hypothetical protein
VGDGQPGRDGLEPRAVGEQVHDGGVGPERDRRTGPVRTEPELLAADGQVPGQGHNAGELDGQVDRVDAVRREHQRGERRRVGDRDGRRGGYRAGFSRCGGQSGWQLQRQPLISRPCGKPVSRESHAQGLVRPVGVVLLAGHIDRRLRVCRSGQTSIWSSSSRCRV